MRRMAPILALLLGVSACGSTGGTPDTSVTTSLVATTSSEAPTTTPEAGFPVTIEAANGPVAIEETPQRIVSLAPTATEMLFAIGAGDQVVAVDEYSNHPEDAPITDLSGFEPNVEAVAAFEPDLVVVSDDLNDIVAALTAIQIPVIHHPAAATLEETYLQIEQLGAATGKTGEASVLVASIQGDIAGLETSAPDSGRQLTYYHELDASLFTVTSDTFIGEIYSLAGLENIADGADGAETRYPQLSGEYIIDSDPDLIFLADTKCCGESPETVAARPGWEQLTAVTTDSVVSLDDDIASRWGPRVVDFLGEIVDAVLRVEVVGS